MDSGVVVTGTKSLFQTFADAPPSQTHSRLMSKPLKGMNLPRMGMAMTPLRVRDQTCTSEVSEVSSGDVILMLTDILPATQPAMSTSTTTAPRRCSRRHQRRSEALLQVGEDWGSGGTKVG